MAVLGPMVQSSAPADIQATVISVSSLLRRLLYIPLVLFVNILGGYSLEYALFGSAIIYGLILVFLVRGLRNSNA